MAINKAYTAAVALMDTFAFAERDKARGRELATCGDHKFTCLQGGLVIATEGEPRTIFGGIGVGGRMPDEGERLARIGPDATRERRDGRLRV